MKKSPKCKVCKSKMNVYWFGNYNRLTPYVRYDVRVIGLANCPRCYHMEDVTEEIKQISNSQI